LAKTGQLGKQTNRYQFAAKGNNPKLQENTWLFLLKSILCHLFADSFPPRHFSEGA
jgi:hypothetical protein